MELRGGVAGRWRIQHNVFCGFHFSPYSLGVIMCHGVSYVQGSGDAYKVLVARSGRNRLLGSPSCRCVDNIKRVAYK